MQPSVNRQMTILEPGSSSHGEVNNDEVLPGMDFAAAARIGPALALHEICRLY
ncbi:hypothetical protein X734_31130 [Mesorhizobium sp. L2C084A000]|nr:hypothetical protein X734_31130 [Mesorhizobium sp. L2C084A000]